MNLEVMYSKKAEETDSPLERENAEFIARKVRFFKGDVEHVLATLQGAADGWAHANPKSNVVYTQYQERAQHMYEEINFIKLLMAKERLIASEYKMQVRNWGDSKIGKVLYPRREDYVTPHHVFLVLRDTLDGAIKLDDVTRWFREYHPEHLEKRG